MNGQVSPVVGCLLAILFVIVIAVGSSLLTGLLLMLFWNWIAVSIFHAPHLTYWQAWGLMFLISLVAGLFRSSTTINRDKAR